MHRLLLRGGSAQPQSLCAENETAAAKTNCGGGPLSFDHRFNFGGGDIAAIAGPHSFDPFNPSNPDTL